MALILKGSGVMVCANSDMSACASLYIVLLYNPPYSYLREHFCCCVYKRQAKGGFSKCGERRRTNEMAYSHIWCHPLRIRSMIENRLGVSHWYDKQLYLIDREYYFFSPGKHPCLNDIKRPGITLSWVTGRMVTSIGHWLRLNVNSVDWSGG